MNLDKKEETASTDKASCDNEQGSNAKVEERLPSNDLDNKPNIKPDVVQTEGECNQTDVPSTDQKSNQADTPEKTEGSESPVKKEQPEPDQNQTQPDGNGYICQYCERELSASDVLVKHEMQHLVGNNYEVC